MASRRGQPGRRTPSRTGDRKSRSGATAGAPRGGAAASRAHPPPTHRRPVPPGGPRSGRLRSVEDVLARQPWGLLAAPLLRAGADVEATTERLRGYARLLLEWNRSVSNILSRNDETRIVERHLLESIAPAHWLIEGGCRRWIDFGSGAGLPAIPLVLAGVGGGWTLVESRRSKALFLRKVIQHISLSDVDVVHDRLENMAADHARAGTFDGFTSRATLRLGPTLGLAASIVRPGGVAFLWKGSGREREMAGDPGWKGAWEIAGILPVGAGPNEVARFIRILVN